MKVLILFATFVVVSSYLRTERKFGDYNLIKISFDTTAISSFVREGNIASRSERILGGFEAVDGQFPWAVRRVGRSGRVYYYCSGSIISKDFALTAAHCTSKLVHFTFFQVS